MTFLIILKHQTKNINLSIGDLKKDVEYPVQSMKAVDTKFGPSVSCVLRDPDSGGAINVFLPKSVQLMDEEIAHYNLGEVAAVRLIFRSMSKRSFIIDFVWNRIENSDHDSDSEEELDSPTTADEIEESVGENFRFFIGKDGETLWANEPVASISKTKSKNIIKIFPGPKELLVNVKQKLNVFHNFFLWI